MGPGFFTPAHFKGHGCGARVRGANGPTSPVDCVGLGRRTNETAERKKGETVVEPNETVQTNYKTTKRKKGEAVVQTNYETAERKKGRPSCRRTMRPSAQEKGVGEHFSYIPLCSSQDSTSKIQTQDWVC